MRLLRLLGSLSLLATVVSCGTMQTSDFEVMVKLPASEDCHGFRVMSGKETRYPAFQCEQIVKRAVFLTSANWAMLRGDILTNCQYQECKQIAGAFDALFLAIDKGLQEVPIR